MKTEDLGNSKFVNLIFKPAGVLMGSKFRKWLMDPVKTLKIANVHPTQTILEVGCGTGFFTIPAAKMIGEQGSLIAMDASSGFLKVVAKKVEKANLKNVSIIQRDALNTRLETARVKIWGQVLQYHFCTLQDENGVRLQLFHRTLW